MNWVFDDSLQYTEDPQMWAANARETADAWVFVKITRMPYCCVEEIDPDELVQEMTGTGEYDCYFFAHTENRYNQHFIGWINTNDELWKFAKRNRILKMLFCRKSKKSSENLLEPWQSSFV